MHPECMQADALATLLTVMGPLEGMAFARQHEIAALFAVHEHGQAHKCLVSPHWASEPSSS